MPAPRRQHPLRLRVHRRQRTAGGAAPRAIDRPSLVASPPNCSDGVDQQPPLLCACSLDQCRHSGESMLTQSPCAPHLPSELAHPAGPGAGAGAVAGGQQVAQGARPHDHQRLRVRLPAPLLRPAAQVPPPAGLRAHGSMPYAFTVGASVAQRLACWNGPPTNELADTDCPVAVLMNTSAYEHRQGAHEQLECVVQLAGLPAAMPSVHPQHLCPT